MSWLKAWRGLFVREYLEHRTAFVWFPLGILVLLSLSAVSGLVANRVRLDTDFHLGNAIKLFELGYLVLIALWLAYLAVALFFYFGDAFAADRRNNAMLFWKSMPLSDVRILSAKFLAGITMFPLVIFAIAAVSGIVYYLGLLAANRVFPGLIPPDPLKALWSYLHISAFALYYMALALLWYAPFFAWVGGLSTVLGRWSLPLAFVIPGVLAVMENMTAFAYVPRGGYLWQFLSRRLQFGLTDTDYGFLIAAPVQFDVRTYVFLLNRDIDWPQLGIGLLAAAVLIWLASLYRRRRVT
jgi:ABC-2 type transport system permease protein